MREIFILNTKHMSKADKKTKSDNPHPISNGVNSDLYDFVKKQDAEVYAALEGEEKREAEGLELIPSENYVSRAVREANGSCLTNKYSEGYPGKRYYGGQTYTDMVETLAIERAKQLFNCGYANVQTLGGANANIAMYFALLQPGDTVLGMDSHTADTSRTATPLRTSPRYSNSCATR